MRERLNRQRIQISDGRGDLVTAANPLPIVASGDSRDDISDGLVVIDYAHHEAHEGDAFETTAVDTAMGDGDDIVLAFKTPAGTKRMHLLVEFATAAGGHVDILEGPTWTNQSGSLNPIFNRKREVSMGSSGVLEDQAQAGFVASDNMILDPTSLAGGTLIHTHYTFGSNKTPATGRGVTEWLLKPDTQYAIRITADGVSNGCQLRLEWYEHTDSN